MSQHLIELHDAVARNPLVRLDAPISASFNVNEHIAVIGPNGAGKSLFIDTMLGKNPLRSGVLTYDFSPSASDSVYENVRYLTFRDTYGTADANYYHQQRWNSTEQDDVPTVREQLGEVSNEFLCGKLFELFGIEHLMDKRVILLSSGELRKFQLIKALASAPRLLIIDNPFIGLDAEARDLLKMLLKELSDLEHLQVVLVVSIHTDIPEFITHVIPVSEKVVGEKMTREAFLDNIPPTLATSRKKLTITNTDNLISSRDKEIAVLNKVTISYGERCILKSLDWTIQKGEHWALTGENGAGKSTLLSLLCADNPQSYACDIRLFGKKRGTGESIWDIKKRIGYVSPEMHRAYMKNIPTIEIVASGLHDSIGLYRRAQPEDRAVCLEWMATFGIEELSERPFLQLSSGEQRLALLARAFVKNPDLLILDEPLHGLDLANRKKVRQIIGRYAEQKDKTLIMVSHYEQEFPDVIDKRMHLWRNL